MLQTWISRPLFLSKLASRRLSPVSAFCVLAGLVSLTSSNLLAGPCVTLTLDQYVASGFSCSIGDKTFHDFNAALSSTALIGSSANPSVFSGIQVTPSGNSATENFSFQANFAASGITGVEAFLVIYTGDAPAIDPFVSTTLSLEGASVSGFPVLASITAAEALCFNGSFTTVNLGALPPTCSTGVGANLGLLSQITNANLNATVTLNGFSLTQLGFAKLLQMNGVLGGTASVTALDNSTSAQLTPEPSSWLLGCTGLAALITRRWCRRPSDSKRENNVG